MHDETTARRKDAHLDLCATEEVAPVENSTLFDHVKLVHCAMPELDLSQVDIGLTWFGKKLKAPILITGMTGGTARAAQVNRDVALVAEEFGVAFGVGSQRAMAERPELVETFAVRAGAPTTVVIGNLGLVQAANMTVEQIRRLTDAIGADALALVSESAGTMVAKVTPQTADSFEFALPSAPKDAKPLVFTRQP